MEEKLWNIKQFCEHLNIKESTGRAWVFQRRIPFVKIGKLVRFRPSEIEKWLRSAK
jgi:excisionase family DNA binding protein